MLPGGQGPFGPMGCTTPFSKIGLVRLVPTPARIGHYGSAPSRSRRIRGCGVRRAPISNGDLLGVIFTSLNGTGLVGPTAAPMHAHPSSRPEPSQPPCSGRSRTLRAGTRHARHPPSATLRSGWLRVAPCRWPSAILDRSCARRPIGTRSERRNGPSVRTKKSQGHRANPTRLPLDHRPHTRAAGPLRMWAEPTRVIDQWDVVELEPSRPLSDTLGERTSPRPLKTSRK